jgi:WD40 repeat protein/predicted Ser/Thr protein kinase
MDLERQRRAQRLLAELLDLPSADRDALLRRECTDDTELRREVESLLAAAASSAGFLDTPAIASARETLTEEITLVGRFLGGFEILDELGRGGMGVVYRARQRSPERIVAVKVTPGAFSPSARRRFDAESRALARMQHPSIATVLEAGVDGTTGVAWIAMEYVEDGASIATYARERSLPLNDLLALFVEACEAVHHGHLKGVIHRDLKPTNLLVGRDGRVKVIDFGIARLLGPDDSRVTLTAAGIPIGTLAYMSPEQCTGDAADVRSDVYSLGVVLHELVSGTQPLAVQELSLESALRTIRSQAPPPLRRIVPSTPVDLETIVLTALEKNPDRRYQSVAALIDDLHRLRDRRPIEARPARWTHHAKLFAQRHRALAIAASVVLLSMAIATAVSVRFALVASSELVERQRAESIAQQERDAAIRHSYVATIALAGAALEAGEIGRVRQHIGDVPERLRGWEWTYLDRQSRPALTTFETHRSRVLTVACSPTMDLIASGDITGSLRFWHREGTPAAEPMTFERGVFAIDISRDGSLLAVGSMQMPIRLYGIDRDGDLRLTALPQEFPLISGGVSCVSISPDGTLLAYAGERGCRVWQIADARERFSAADPGAIRSIAFDPQGKRLAIAHEGTIAIHSTLDGSILRSLQGPSWVYSMAWTPDATRLIAGDTEGVVRLWDPESGEVRRKLTGHRRTVQALGVTPDGQGLLSGGVDQSMILWDLATFAPRRILPGHSEAVHAIAIARDGTFAVSASSDRTARVWSLADDDASTKQFGERWRPLVPTVAYSPDSRRLIAGNERGLVLLLDAETWETIATRDTPGLGCSAAAFSPDGTRLAIASGPTSVLILDAAMKETLLTLENTGDLGDSHSTTRRVASLAFSPDGRLLCTGSADHAVRVWSLDGERAGTVIASLPAGGGGHGADVTAVTFSPDGNAVYSGSVDRSVARLDVATNVRRWIRTVHDDSVSALAIHPSGRELVSGGRDQRMVILNAEDGRTMDSLVGHGQSPTRIAFMSNGTRMVSASLFLDVKVWDWPGRSELLTLRAPALTSIRAMAIRPDEQEIVVGGAGAITRWSVVRVRHLNSESPSSASTLSR